MNNTTSLWPTHLWNIVKWKIFTGFIFFATGGSLWQTILVLSLQIFKSVFKECLRNVTNFTLAADVPFPAFTSWVMCFLNSDWTDFHSFELDLSSVNIWSIAWNESQVPDIVSSCRPSLPADVFEWSQLAITPSDAVTQTLRAPSTCDGRLSNFFETIVIKYCMALLTAEFCVLVLWNHVLSRALKGLDLYCTATPPCRL